MRMPKIDITNDEFLLAKEIFFEEKKLQLLFNMYFLTWENISRKIIYMVLYLYYHFTATVGSTKMKMFGFEVFNDSMFVL